MRAKETNFELNEERSYSESDLRVDFTKYVKANKVKKRHLSKLWSELYSGWYSNKIHSPEDVIVFIKRLQESIAGGAGYAVYGGGHGGGFGMPGRGRGFGGSANLGGGPNLMYTYSVKPLTQDMQQPGTPQDDDEAIHTGSKIKGKILNTQNDIEGQILHIEEDHDNNVKYYLVLDPTDGMQKKVDPTSAYLVQIADFIDPFTEDLPVEEGFYPNLD